jgi:hypothetical protein
MKKILIFVLSILFIGTFDSCEKDENSFQLNGTQWLYQVINGDDFAIVKFISTSQIILTNNYDGNVASGTYTFADPTLILIVNGETINFTKVSDTLFTGKIAGYVNGIKYENRVTLTKME